MLGFNKFLLEEDAIGVIECVLILAVLVSLVVIFKKQLTSLIRRVFGEIFDQADNLY